MSRTFSIWLSVMGMVMALFAGAGTAEAQGRKRVAVMGFEGPSASSIQSQITRALRRERREVKLVSARDVRNTADRLDNEMESDADYRELGEALELSAFVEGKSARRGRNLQVTVTVRNAATGEIIHEQAWTKRRSQLKTLRGEVWDALGPAISESSAPTGKKARSKPVAAPEPEPEEELPEEELPEEEEEIAEEVPPPPPPKQRPRKPRPDPEEEEVAEEAVAEEDARDEKKPAKSGTHPALIASIGPRLAWRTLKYDGPTQFHSYHNSGGSPAFSLPINVQYFPGAHVSNAFYSNLGLELDFDYALGLKSKLASGQKLNTTSYELGAGAILRIPLTDFEPRFRLGYVRQAFDVDIGQGSMLPGVTYSAVRIGTGTAIKFVDWLAFDVQFAYLFVLDTGELGSPEYGEDVTTGAWEAGAGFLLNLQDVYGLRLGLDYRRYKYDFSLTDNERLAVLPNSGTDGYLRVTLAFQFKLPGVL